MDSDGLPLVGPGVDLSKVTAIHPKRMLAFLNHFIIHTTRFLNKFSCVCEQKLLDLNQRIQKLEVTMNILEAKLASIPGLENVTVEQTSTSQVAESNLPQVTAGESEEQKPSEEGEAAPEAPPTMTVSQDPRYMKYFKMINMPGLSVEDFLGVLQISFLMYFRSVGVPIEPLRNKVLMEGLDPDLLFNPRCSSTSHDSAGKFESSFGSEDSGDESSD